MECHPLSLHDALPISDSPPATRCRATAPPMFPTPTIAVVITKILSESVPARIFVMTTAIVGVGNIGGAVARSEEHTSELQSHTDFVCRLLLDKKQKHS